MLLWFAETALVASALAAVAAAVPRLRRLGPAARHALWLVVLIKLVSPPFLRSPWPVVMPWSISMESTGHDATDLSIASALADAASDRDWQGNRVAAAERQTRGWAEGVLSIDRAELGRWALWSWLAVTSGLAVAQSVRLIKFRRKLRHAQAPPEWIVNEAGWVAARMGVRVPETLVVPGLGVPMLWCLSRSKLLLPAHLVGSLGADRWRGLLAHELAHLRRGDPWVRRLELIAGLIWWWNPVYLLARRRLDNEAELACDAWVLWALPGDRVVYAETMFEICASLARPPARPPAPALGVTGAGRFFERRLTMILRDHVPCHLSLPGLLGAGLLALVALPAWSAADPPAPSPESAPAVAADELIAAALTTTAQEPGDDDADDDDDSPDAAKLKAEKAAIKAKVKAELDAARAAREAARAEQREAIAKERQAKRAAVARNRGADDGDKRPTSASDEAKKRELIRKLSVDLTGKPPTDAEVREFLADDSPRAIAKLVDRLTAKLDDKEASDTAKKRGARNVLAEKLRADAAKRLAEAARNRKETDEKLGFDTDMAKRLANVARDKKELADKLGPEFEKKMTEMGRKIEKEMTAKFGPGSDFDKKMKAMSKELTEKLGPGSEFEAKMKEFAERLEKGEFRLPEGAKSPRSGDNKPLPKVKPPSARPKPPTRSSAGGAAREARIKALEAQLDRITAELKRLKDAGDDPSPDEKPRQY
jgi:beta-lactamase regulating signal transducer with metallopeptidase domain